MEFSLYEKISYYAKYLYDTYYLKMYPYKNIIIDDDFDETAIGNNIKRMNYICWGHDMSLKFLKKEKVVVNYSGDKEFNTVFFAESHDEINNFVKKIIENFESYHQKIKCNFPNFIETISFVKNNDEIIDVTDIINNSINYENNNITFGDISFLCNENTKNINTIKITYVKKIRALKKELNFNENKDKDIGLLNEIMST